MAINISSGDIKLNGTSIIGGGGGGTVNSVKMNNGTPIQPDSNGVVDLGTVITDDSGKANDSAVVHNTGAENVGGIKTFTSKIRSSNGSYTGIEAETQDLGNDAARGYISIKAISGEGDTSSTALFQNITDEKLHIDGGVDVNGDFKADTVKDGLGNVLSEMFWKGTTTQWTNLSAAQKAKYDGKAVIFTDDAGDYTGMPQPYSFTLSGSGSVSTTFSHASITSNMRLIEASIGTPSAIRSDISITTANGSMTVTATVNGSSVVKVLMQPCKAEIALT